MKKLGVSGRISSSAIEAATIEIKELTVINAKLRGTFNAKLKSTYIMLLALVDTMPEAPVKIAEGGG